MTLRHLKIYVAVCETGTLTAAGKKLFIAQPAVSVAISELEAHYGVHFFDRISNRLHITDTGRQFKQYAQHIISLYEEMEHNITNGDGIGTLRIGSSITIANCFLPMLIKELKEQHTQLTVKVMVQNSELIESNILSNHIDIGLIEGSVHNGYVNSIPFMTDKLVFIAPPKHPLSQKKEVEVSDLEFQNFLLREQGSAGREIFDGIVDTYALSVNRVWESVSTQAIIRGVEQGLGLSILPYLLVQEEVENGKIIAFGLKDISLTRLLSIVHHKNKFLAKSALDFIEICQTRMRS